MKFNINGSTVEVSDEDLSKAIEEKTESLDVKAEDLEVRSKSDFEVYTTNIRAEAKTQGEEIGRKELFKTLELDTEGTGAHKDLNKSVEALNTWSNGLKDQALLDAKIEPDKKVQELTADLNTMRTQFNQEQIKVAEAQGQLTEFKTGIEKTAAIAGALPDNLNIPKDDMILLLSSRVPVKKNDNGIFVATDSTGNTIKNQNLEPLSLKDAFIPFFNDNPHYLKKADGGAGGGDSGTGGSKQSFEEFTKEMTDQGMRPNSPQFNDIMIQRMKDGKLADV